MSRGRRAAGDLIPWTVAQQFQDEDFPSLSGARVVRIATHPDYQGMGYGNRALELLRRYYEFKIPNLEDDDDSDQETRTEVAQVDDDEIDLLHETIAPRKSLPPLLLKLSERRPEHLDYLGVSFGVTEQLLRFWKKAKFVPVYLRQTSNDITGEHSCIMLSCLNENADWLVAYWKDFRRRFVTLLSSAFRDFSPSLGLAILTNKNVNLPAESLPKHVLDAYFTAYDLGRLEKYCNNMADYHLIMDLVNPLARLYFLNLMGDTQFSVVQAAILLSLGLQHNNVDKTVAELNKCGSNTATTLLASQVLGLFNRSVRKSVKYLNEIIESNVSSRIGRTENAVQNIQVNPEGAEDMQRELEEDAKELERKQKAELNKMKQQLKNESLEQYAIKGSEKDWSNALGSSKGNKLLVSVKSGEKYIKSDGRDDLNSGLDSSKKKNKNKNKRKRSP